MVAQGNGHGATVARAGSTLACFGVNQVAAELYFFGTGTEAGLHQLTQAPGGWKPAPLSGPPCALNSPLACFGFDGTDPRLFYIAENRQIIRLSYLGPEWMVTRLTSQAAHDSPLTCAGLGGEECRLYYVGADRQVHEQTADKAGTFHGQAIAGTTVTPGSGLTCTQDSQGLVTAFYIEDTDRCLHALTCLGPGKEPEIQNLRIEGTGPAPGSALACVYLPIADLTCIFYLGPRNHVNVVVWSAADHVIQTMPGKAMPSSALTSFAVGGDKPRLYYLDTAARVTELAQIGNDWAAPKALTGAVARDSALTCYGYQGTDTRLFYQDAQHRVSELAWENHQFTNHPL
jgi:hypothetical protein